MVSKYQSLPFTFYYCWIAFSLWDKFYYFATYGGMENIEFNVTIHIEYKMETNILQMI